MELNIMLFTVLYLMLGFVTAGYAWGKKAKTERNAATLGDMFEVAIVWWIVLSLWLGEFLYKKFNK